VTFLFTERSATFSADRVYRYRLGRRWGKGRSVVTWLMLNPSKADENEEDPTIRRCLGFSHDWGFEGVEIVNLFALVSTNPKKLLTHPEPIGSENDQAIFDASIMSSLIICAWGDLKQESMRQRAVRICRELNRRACGLDVLRLTQNGYPWHPLYLPKNLTAQPWTEWERMR
jgi:hypothetical protein